MDLNLFVQKVEGIGGTVWEYLKETEVVKSFTTTDSRCMSNLFQDTDGYPIVTIPLKEVWKDDAYKVRKCAIRHSMPSDTSSKSCKTVLLVGATGTGKSTLLDGMINHIVGVKWEDNARLKIINLTDEENERRDAGEDISQTEWVTAYAIPTDTNSSVPYDLLVIDTPGFGDTRGIQQDQRITSQMEYLFQNPQHHGIDSIDGICFLVQAPLVRLTPTQKYIFDRILSLFGNDVAQNIFIMVTFADAKKPPIIDTLKKENVPFVKYFKFNNSALFSKQERQDIQSSDNEGEEDYSSDLDQMFWAISKTNFRNFFNALQKVQPKSLTLTADVLKNREKLKCDLAYIEEKNKQATQKMARIEQETEALRANEANMRENKDFEYEVDEEKMEKVPIESGRYVTNCSFCHETCHASCAFVDDKDKKYCIAMTNGKCTCCTNKCDWSAHYNQGYIFELVVKKVRRTSKEIKQRYESAKEGMQTASYIISKLGDEYRETCVQVTSRVHRARDCLRKLNEIALKPDPLSEIDYIDLLIQDEKKQAKLGYLERIVQLEILQNRAKLLKEIQEKKYVEKASHLLNKLQNRPKLFQEIQEKKYVMKTSPLSEIVWKN